MFQLYRGVWISQFLKIKCLFVIIIKKLYISKKNVYNTHTHQFTLQIKKLKDEWEKQQRNEKILEWQIQDLKKECHKVTFGKGEEISHLRNHS